MRNGQKQPSEQIIGGLVEDEDDGVGVVDDDLLVALNYEALKKMNCYAHAISPRDILLDKVQSAAAALFSSEALRGTNQEGRCIPPCRRCIPMFYLRLGK